MTVQLAPPLDAYVTGLREMEDRLAAETSLHAYVRQAWHLIEGAVPFDDNWHIQAICEHIEAMFSGQIKHLIINVPPRTGKSIITSVAMPSWRWVEAPAEQFVYISYAGALTIRDSSKCRRLIESPWYQRRWGERFKLLGDSNTKLRYDNDQFGYRIATSLDAMVTGEGGSVVVCDDLNSARDTSDTMLESAIKFWDEVLPTRLNDLRTGHRLQIQQRIHVRDVTGHIQTKEHGDYVMLILPMEFEPKRRCFTVPLKSTGGKKWCDPRTKEGELLWPKRIGPKELKSLKAEIGNQYIIAGQLQQRPSPEGGGLIKRDWFKWWKSEDPPKLDFILQSWDTAMSKKEDAAESACITMGVFRDDHKVSNVILLSAVTGQWDYPDLRRIAAMMALDYRNDDLLKPDKTPKKERAPHIILIEAKVSGISLIQDLLRADVPVHRFDPNKHGDKVNRVKLVSHIVESGRVWVPASAPAFTQLRSWADKFVTQCADFPKGDKRDMVDAFSQALIRLMSSGWVYNATDKGGEPVVEYETSQAQEAIY